LPVSRQWSLPHALSKHADVILLSLGQRPFQRLAIEQLSDSLWLVEGAFTWALSAPRARLGRALFPVELLRIRRALERIGHTSWTLWLSVPDLGFVPSTLPPDRLVYDCIDPPFGAADAEMHDRREQAVVRRAGVSFATAGVLEERIRPFARRVARLPNGCSDLGPLPPSRGDRRLTVGYLGTIDWRVDLRSLEFAARELPDCHFVFGGRVNAERSAEVQQRFRDLPNVNMLGSVPEEDGQSLIESFDVGLVPFNEDSTGDAINPVKMYAYLERGVPVVATDIRECRGLDPCVRTGSGPDGFIRAIQAALADSTSTRDSRRELALQNTWERRASDAIGELKAAGVQC
jgi:UDP-galactopyranose mutase